MSRLQQQRSGRRDTRSSMGARTTRLAIDAALSAMGISQKSWCFKKTPERELLVKGYGSSGKQRVADSLPLPPITNNQ